MAYTTKTLTVGDILGVSSCMFANYKLTFMVTDNGWYYIDPETIENEYVRKMFNWTRLCLDLSGLV